MMEDARVTMVLNALKRAVAIEDRDEKLTRLRRIVNSSMFQGVYHEITHHPFFVNEVATPLHDFVCGESQEMDDWDRRTRGLEPYTDEEFAIDSIGED